MGLCISSETPSWTGLKCFVQMILPNPNKTQCMSETEPVYYKCVKRQSWSLRFLFILFYWKE